MGRSHEYIRRIEKEAADKIRNWFQEMGYGKLDDEASRQ